MKIVSWNVNGIRAVLGKGFHDFVKKENPEIICIQETKAHPEQVDVELKDYEHHFWNSAEKKGYSGTAIFSKIKPLKVIYDMGIEEHDKEGRIITLEFKDFFLTTVYTPNSQRGLTRLEYRQKWDKDFLAFLKNLEEQKPVIFCGDLNVAHQEIDLKNPKSNKKNAGFTEEERQGFTKFVENGFIDTFRDLYPEKIEYSWWSYMHDARKKNIGWRIDYFAISPEIKSKVKDSKILCEVHGSDHCPVLLELKD